MSFTKDSFRQLLSKLKDTAVASEGNEDAFAEAMATLESEGNDTLTQWNVATGEAIQRKKKIRTLEEQLEDANLDKEGLQEKLDKQSEDGDDTELEALREFKSKAIEGQKSGFGDTLNKIRGHKNFDKAKQYLRLPDPDKEGNYDVSEMSEEDLSHNLSEMDKFNSLGYFGETTGKEKVDVDGGKEKEVPQDFSERLEQASTQEEVDALHAEYTE